jgi:small subunit ribosomal protein S4
MENKKCKTCRRLGEKLFLKGERCFLPKCSIIRRPYFPGQKEKRKQRSFSEYGKELKEKQKLRNWYGLEEKQFQRYVKQALEARGKVEDASVLLVQVLESRLDNILFRLGFALSRNSARQIISHNHILVNNKPINIVSFLVKKGDLISIKPSSMKKKNFFNLSSVLKKHNAPSWLKSSAEKLEGKVLEVPKPEESISPAEISSVFEYYSR